MPAAWIYFFVTYLHILPTYPPYLHILMEPHTTPGPTAKTYRGFPAVLNSTSEKLEVLFLIMFGASKGFLRDPGITWAQCPGNLPC